MQIDILNIQINEKTNEGQPIFIYIYTYHIYISCICIYHAPRKPHAEPKILCGEIPNLLWPQCKRCAGGHQLCPQRTGQCDLGGVTVHLLYVQPSCKSQVHTCDSQVLFPIEWYDGNFESSHTNPMFISFNQLCSKLIQEIIKRPITIIQAGGNCREEKSGCEAVP